MPYQVGDARASTDSGTSPEWCCSSSSRRTSDTDEGRFDCDLYCEQVVSSSYTRHGDIAGNFAYEGRETIIVASANFQSLERRDVETSLNSWSAFESFLLCACRLTTLSLRRAFQRLYYLSERSPAIVLVKMNATSAVVVFDELPPELSRLACPCQWSRLLTSASRHTKHRLAHLVSTYLHVPGPEYQGQLCDPGKRGNRCSNAKRNAVSTSTSAACSSLSTPYTTTDSSTAGFKSCHCIFLPLQGPLVCIRFSSFSCTQFLFFTSYILPFGRPLSKRSTPVAATMRFTSSLILAGASIIGSVHAQTFESPDFNITEALADKGVNITALPALAALEERSSNGACSIACSSLKLLYGNAVLQEGTSAYDGFTGGYWSVQQASVDPYCIFKPASANQVSIAVLISRLSQCPFAVKSGGHAAFAGASSIEGGITIALERIDDITVSTDKKSVAVGPGNLWFDVYTTLQPQDIAVIGGRVSGIGVGGLTLGGGISFFSNIYGWACDNVLSYEVVTASGIIVTASPTTFSDLFWSLRGGGNNFGIVTKFNLKAISLPGGLMWGGSRIHTADQFPAVVEAFTNLGFNSPKDPNAAQIMSYAYAQSADLEIASADLQYAKPVANAPIFDEYLAIPALMDNTRVRTLTDLTVQFNASNPNGLRESYWTATYKLNQDLVTAIQNIFFDELQSIKDVAGIVPAATLQVISQGQLAQMSKNGGNPLGLSAADGPYILMNPNVQWTNAADDARVIGAYASFVSRCDAEAKKRGLYENYLYMNYASQYQAVVPSYGAANQQRLKQVAAKYDPTGVYQNLQPGYFKLDGSPAGSL
jgi:hypothetical protein